MRVRTLAAPALALTTAGCDLDLGCTARMLDACRKAQDLSAFVGTELAAAVPTGNAVLGEADALHATGRMSIALRATSSTRVEPTMQSGALRVDSVASSTTFGVNTNRSTTVTGDLSVGAFRGFRAGATRVGAVDLLGSVSYVPAFGVAQFRARPRGLGLGVGARLGIVGETRAFPAISASVWSRSSGAYKVESDRLATTDGETQTIELDLLQAVTNSYRIAAAKRIGPLGITAGFGEDAYRVSADYRIAEVERETDSGFRHTIGPRSHRRMVFAGGSYTLGMATIALEAGRFEHGRVIPSINTFAGDGATKARTFVTLGVRIPAGRTHDRGP
jgi:hypothetical protein